MPKYNYTLTNEDGQKKEGSISAPSKESALQSLRTADNIVLAITEDEDSKGWIFGRPKMSMVEKMIFVKNLATMIEVGITVSESLSIIKDQTKKESLKRMFDDIMEMVNSGQSLAKSLKKYDNNFSQLFINMIETGESSGNLQDVLSYLDLQLEKDYELRKKVISALIYPAVIITITLLMAAGIVVFIMPKITNIFKQFKAKLPLPTQLLIDFSNLLRERPLFSLLAFVITIVLTVFILKLKFLQPFWTKILTRLPLFGNITISANVARFTRTINSLIKSSVPITEAITITMNMLDNVLYKDALKEVRDKVEQGGKVGDSLEKYERLFPPMCTKMISLGERTGTLETTTEKVADLYEKDVDTKTRNLSTAVEPMLLVLMAGLVGGIAISIILPIYQLPNLIKR